MCCSQLPNFGHLKFSRLNHNTGTHTLRDIYIYIYIYYLVIWNHLALVVVRPRFVKRYFVLPRKVVRVLYPTVVRRELGVRVGEVYWRPAGDRISNILVHADEHREHDEQNNGIPVKDDRVPHETETCVRAPIKDYQLTTVGPCTHTGDNRMTIETHFKQPDDKPGSTS